MEKIILLDDDDAIVDDLRDYDWEDEAPRSKLYTVAKNDVRDFVEKNYISSLDVLRGCVVDICKVLEDLIPHDIRFSTPLYEAGVSSGERVAKWLVKQFDLKGKSIKEIVYYCDAFFNEFGFGEISFMKHKGYNILRSNGGTFFAKEYGYVGAPVCYYFSGFIAGTTNILAGTKVIVKEISCIAAGDHHCEFVIKQAP